MFHLRIKNHLNAVIAALLLTSASFVAHSTSKQGSLTSHISTESALLTVVNVITPKAGQQDDIVSLLQRGMTETMRFQEGFISANIHKSLDSEHVLVYAQWKSAAHLQAAVDLIMEGKAPNMAKVFASASPDFHPYEVVSIHHDHESN